MTRIKLFGFFFLFVLPFVGAPWISATWAQEPVAAKLSKEDQALLKEVETYLNHLTTIRARFSQASSSGAQAEGKLFVQRPGKMRFEYDPPTPVLVVSDGTWIGYYDLELDQASHALLSSTPASLLVGENIHFGKDIVVTRFASRKDGLYMTIASRADADEARLTLGFKRNPLQLSQWSVLDAQGIYTDVTLNGAKFGESLDPDLFHLKATDEKPQQNLF